MKKSLCLLTLFLSLQAYSGEHCGTQGTILGFFFSHLVVPEFFPPETALVRWFLGVDSDEDIKMCEESYASAYLGEACFYHDQCYGTAGAVKDVCDENLIAGWLSQCEASYDLGYSGDYLKDTCATLCRDFVDAMFALMRYDDGFLCPSCIAFQNSQAKLRS